MAIDRMNSFESSITLSDGGLYLETSENPIVVDIRFKGLVLVESALPEGFFISENRGRMIIARVCEAEMPKLIFRYEGEFDIKRAKLYTEEKSSIASIDLNSHKWGEMDKVYSSYSSEWKNYFENRYYSAIYSRGEAGVNQKLLKGNKSVVINRRFGTNLKGFYLDKEEYKGDVVYDSRGIFYTPDKKILKIKLNKHKLQSLMNRKGRR